MKNRWLYCFQPVSLLLPKQWVRHELTYCLVPPLISLQQSGTQAPSSPVVSIEIHFIYKTHLFNKCCRKAVEPIIHGIYKVLKCSFLFLGKINTDKSPLHPSLLCLALTGNAIHSWVTDVIWLVKKWERCNLNAFCTFFLPSSIIFWYLTLSRETKDHLNISFDTDTLCCRERMLEQ